MLSVTTADLSAPQDDKLLALIGPESGAAARQFRLPLEILAGSRAECWLGSAPVRHIIAPGIAANEDGHYLFGWLGVGDEALQDCAAASEQAYKAISAFLREHGYPWLLRSWNYINDIHHGPGDQERYRQFCVGRHRAVSAAEGFEQYLPAATVIGTTQPGMEIGFLAGKVPGTQVENPRQTPAFRYPREYGPASPSFSRATLLKDERLLLVSGTASVVGHASRHPDNIGAQCAEIIANIRALLLRASELDGGHPAWSPSYLRVFLRNRDYLPQVREGVAQEFGATVPVTYLLGDVCRVDLLLEIDGVFSARSS